MSPCIPWGTISCIYSVLYAMTYLHKRFSSFSVEAISHAFANSTSLPPALGMTLDSDSILHMNYFLKLYGVPPVQIV